MNLFQAAGFWRPAGWLLAAGYRPISNRQSQSTFGNPFKSAISNPFNPQSAINIQQSN
jgi:hypothetical protein